MTNTFEEKQEARRERLERKAAKAKARAEMLNKRARDMAGNIPFGQPILVGHHSEQRDRRYRGKITNTFRQSFDELEKAEHYARKADSVGTGGISSDDPEAIEKLRAELAQLESNQALMKAVNLAIRTNKTAEQKIAAVVALGLSEIQAAEIIKPDFAGRVGFAAYSLTNNNSNMRRIKERIEQLETVRSREDVFFQGKDYAYHEKVEDNRIWFVFEGKPLPATRLLLKSHGFKWSPSRGAWIRQLNGNGLFNAKLVKKALDDASQV